MSAIHRILGLLLVAALGFGCSGTDGHGNEHNGEGRSEESGEHDGEGRGEHDRDGKEHGDEGEEENADLALTATYDKVRNGARLVLGYDEAHGLFVGTVENTTDKKLEAVRVEVHLSNGKELGPTPRADLQPGEKRPVMLKAESTDFDNWTAHPEVGNSEHGHAGESKNGEGKGEHK